MRAGRALRTEGPLRTDVALRTLGSFRADGARGSCDLRGRLDRAVRELNADRADTDHPCDVESPLGIGHADADEASGVVDEELLADRIEHPHGRDAGGRQTGGLIREVEDA